VDIVSPEVRSAMMARIGGKHTKPELVVRRGLFALGYRYRLHDRRLPGKPDIVFPSRRAVVLVSGCFWHGHGCRLFRWPATNAEFWRSKIAGNVARDAEVRERLAAQGWRVLTVWECALRDKRPDEVASVVERVAVWLDGRDSDGELVG
jgi:DNA mismatch endonuclease (patch repair protein)